MGVRTEDKVLFILQKWIKHDEESRRNLVQTLLKFVCFPLIGFQESSDVLSLGVSLEVVRRVVSAGRDGVLLIAGGIENVRSTGILVRRKSVKLRHTSQTMMSGVLFLT